MSKARLFRKKPVIVEAVQFTDFGQHGGAYEFAQANGIGYFDNGDRAWPEVHTLEGVMRMEPLDWLITGINGEKYPCKPDIFEATYEPVAETDPSMRASWSDQENRHIVDVQGDSWALEHPVSCRQAGSLLDCPVHRWWMDTFDAPPAPPGRYQVFEVGGGYELAKRPLPRARIQSHVSATAVPGVLEERARLQQRIDWLFDTLLINHLDCGFDVYVREPVPGWFLDELAARWARREGGSADEYRHVLEMHGWQEEAPSE